MWFDSRVGKIPCRRACNPLQYSCLENPWTEEAGGLQSRVTKSLTLWKQLSTHACNKLVVVQRQHLNMFMLQRQHLFSKSSLAQLESLFRVFPSGDSGEGSASTLIQTFDQIPLLAVKMKVPISCWLPCLIS